MHIGEVWATASRGHEDVTAALFDYDCAVGQDIEECAFLGSRWAAGPAEITVDRKLDRATVRAELVPEDKQGNAAETILDATFTAWGDPVATRTTYTWDYEGRTYHTTHKATSRASEIRGTFAGLTLDSEAQDTTMTRWTQHTRQLR